MSKHWTDNQNLPAPLFDTVIDGSGVNGNILFVVGQAGSMLRQIGVPGDKITELYERVAQASSYEEAVGYVERYFSVRRDGDET